MEIKQAIAILTKQDRQAIRVILSEIYSTDYVFRMFAGTRKPTDIFTKAVLSYVEGKEKTVNEIAELIDTK